VKLNIVAGENPFDINSTNTILNFDKQTLLLRDYKLEYEPRFNFTVTPEVFNLRKELEFEFANYPTLLLSLDSEGMFEDDDTFEIRLNANVELKAKI